MSLEIRPAFYSDTYNIGKLLSLCFYPWGRLFSPFMDVLVAIDVQSRFTENNPQYVCVVAIAPNCAVVGTLEVSIRCVSIGKVPYLFNLAVHPHWRRQGVASKLIACAESEIKRWEVPFLFLHVLAENESACQLYTRSGFECWQKEERWLRPDRLLYRKKLENC